MDLAHRTSHPSIPLASPASASSSTLITTPLPVGRSKESLRLPSFPSSSSSPDDARDGLAPGAPRPRLQIGTGTGPPPTRMSASGFVEPHHSNVPRRVRMRTRTKTKTGLQTQENGGVAGTRDQGRAESDEEEEGAKTDTRRVMELRRSVKEALTPGRRWSDSDSDSDSANEDKDEDDAQEEKPSPQPSPPPLPKSDETPAITSHSIYAHPSGATSSRQLNTERTPLHLLSLKLPPSPSLGSPTAAGVSAPVGGLAILSGAAMLPQVYPQTAPAGNGTFPVGVWRPETPPMAHISTLQQPTSSLRPGTLPRRRRPTPATPTPATKTQPARTASSSDEAALPPAQSPPRPSSSSPHTAPDTPRLAPAPMRLPTAPAPPPPAATTPGPGKPPGTVGVRFHGHHPDSSSSSEGDGDGASSSSHGSPLPRPETRTQLDLLKAAFRVNGIINADLEAGGGRADTRRGGRDAVSVGGKGKGKEKDTKRATGKEQEPTKRSRSCVTPRSRARSVQRNGGKGSRSRESGWDRDGGGDGDQARSKARAAAKERRREERSRRRIERAKRRKARKAMEEGMCVQRVGGRGRMEVAFFADDDDGHVGEGETEGSYVLLRVVEPESDSEDDEDEDVWDSDVDLDGDEGKEVMRMLGPPTLSASETPSSPVLTSTTPIPGSQTTVEPTNESAKPGPKELRLYLPSDLSTHIDGVPALSVAQIREGCEFIRSVLSSPVDSTTSASTARPCRVRVIAPRARPEDAWAVALCYQVGVESSVTTAATTSVKGALTTAMTTSAGAARLIAATNASTNARISESSSRDAVRRLSVPVPVPPLALVRGDDGEVEGVVEVAVDVERLDEDEDNATVDVDALAITDINEVVPSPTSLPSTSSPSSNLKTDADPGPDADSAEEDTFMLHPTYTYSAVHRLAMRLLDEGAGEWHTRGKQWEERVERMQYAVGATTGAGPGAIRVDLQRPNVDVRRRVRHESRRNEDRGDVIGGTDFSEEGRDDGGAEGGDSGSEEDEDEYEEEDEEDEEESEDVISAGARQGSESTGECEVDGHFEGADGENERGRTHEPHTRMGHGVPLPSKYEEPSSAFVSSGHGRSKSRVRSKSKVGSHSKSRARSMSVSASASKATARGRRKSRLSMSYDDDGEDNEGVVVDRATRKARHAELRRLRLVQRRARKEEEEAEAYAGVRMEWRGVLSFDGVQTLVGVWTPVSAVL
ncbi:hypothetical protein D9619_002237 [Psilocybe cf. subviscida]|uniref:Uncharacterized protein n=1 Tax=Psilocybe cf. subviscida TaxID=2480587 RepID=A0A8H5BCP7_9AGAR|nr:hypothetical protein D9619_002237 [Psilocybe cf. subviscida]